MSFATCTSHCHQHVFPAWLTTSRVCHLVTTIKCCLAFLFVTFVTCCMQLRCTFLPKHYPELASYSPPASTATVLAWIRSPTTIPIVQNWTDQKHQADPFIQGLAAPVEKWFLNILTESCEYSNWADRSIMIQGLAALVFHRSKKWFLNTLTKTVNSQLSWQNHRACRPVQGLAALVFQSEK